MVENTIDGLQGGDCHDTTVRIVVEGENQSIVDKVTMHTQDQAVRAMQAFDEEQHPDECEGSYASVAWDRVFETDEEGNDA